MSEKKELTKSQKNFKEGIIKRSICKDYDKALLEWIKIPSVVNRTNECNTPCYLVDTHKKDKRCLCGEPIRKISLYRNFKTKKNIILGVGCCMKIDVRNKIRSRKKQAKDINKIRTKVIYEVDNGEITEEEYEKRVQKLIDIYYGDLVIEFKKLNIEKKVERRKKQKIFNDTMEILRKDKRNELVLQKHLITMLQELTGITNWVYSPNIKGIQSLSCKVCGERIEGDINEHINKYHK